MSSATVKVEFPVGSRARVNSPKWPGVWTVASHGPANTVLRPADGGRGLRVPHSMLLHEDAAPVVVTADTYRLFDLGAFVEVQHGKWQGVYVVIKDDGGDRVNIAAVGGDGGRYVRIMRSSLRAVDVTWSVDSDLDVAR